MDTCKAIEEHVSRLSRIVFPDKLVFAFVFGSAAKGYLSREHDIDLFLCVREWDSADQRLLLSQVRTMHQTLGYTLDESDPFEMTTLDQLWDRMKYAERIRIRPVIRSYYAYESIVWMDILSGQKMACVGDTALMDLFSERAQRLVADWRDSILQVTGKSFVPGQSFSSLCEEALTYEKRGRNESAMAVFLGDVIEPLKLTT